jgi:Holliday junction resolvasome RuvABC DNA-binding subunit
MIAQGRPAAASAHVGARGASPAVARGPIESGSKLDTAILCIQACTALTGLGWKRAIARAAVDAALAAQGPETTLERLIFESLRRCPAPRA